MEHKNSEKDTTQVQQVKRMAFVTLQSGCLTIIIAGVALLIGLWVDSHLGTLPRWTLIALVGSAPLTFGGVFLIVRKALHRGNSNTESR